MDYSVKPRTDAATGPRLVRMTQTPRADDRGNATESKFYLPAGVTATSDGNWVEAVRTTLFGERI